MFATFFVYFVYDSYTNNNTRHLSIHVLASATNEHVPRCRWRLKTSFRTMINTSRRRCGCLSVCLSATLRKSWWSDLHKNFTADVSVVNEELIKFWMSSSTGSGSRIFWRILQHCEIGHFFHNLVYISGENNRIFMNIFRRCIRGHPYRCTRSPEPDNF